MKPINVSWEDPSEDLKCSGMLVDTCVVKDKIFGVVIQEESFTTIPLNQLQTTDFLYNSVMVDEAPKTMATPESSIMQDLNDVYAPMGETRFDVYVRKVRQELPNLIIPAMFEWNPAIEKLSIVYKRVEILVPAERVYVFMDAFKDRLETIRRIANAKPVSFNASIIENNIADEASNALRFAERFDIRKTEKIQGRTQDLINEDAVLENEPSIQFDEQQRVDKLNRGEGL
jgi:hypothetical protein